MFFKGTYVALVTPFKADGSVDEKRKTFRIHLSKKDKELVDLYKEIICPEARTFVVK